MHLNYYFLRQLSAALNQRLNGMSPKSCFTQNRNELILELEGEKETFCIRALLDGATTLLTFPEEFARARKNSVDLFQQIIGQSVLNISQSTNDRSFVIHFEQGHSLIFKMHGGMSNIILHHKDADNVLFKSSLRSDEAISPDSLHRIIDQSQENRVKTQFDLKSLYPTFNMDVHQYLERKDFSSASDSEKTEILNETLVKLKEPVFYIVTQDKVKLTLLEPDDVEYRQYINPIAAAHEFGTLYHKWYFLNKEKSGALNQLNDQIRKSRNYIGSNAQKLRELENSRSYRELADILMANLHVPIPAKSKYVELLDFYTNKDIKIKVNENLTLQKNAENYYRKAKNQSIEIQTLERNIKTKEQLLLDLTQTRSEIEQAEDIRTIRSILKEQAPQKKKQDTTERPFMELEIDGYQVWIGRSAKNNDLLTQKYAHKNDLWLHAKDVPGSHVVIKSKGNDQYPKPLIEKVAQLASYYSKRKNDTLCPVIYTSKKYVTKPKGFAPGMVRLLREEVVLVKPAREVQ